RNDSSDHSDHFESMRAPMTDGRGDSAGARSAPPSVRPSRRSSSRRAARRPAPHCAFRGRARGGTASGARAPPRTASRRPSSDARVVEFAAGTPTADAAARAVGCELGEIVKSLVFVCDGAYVLALVPGDARADEAKVAAAVGARDARVARGHEVEHATGFAPGA